MYTLIIAGSRSITSYEILEAAIAQTELSGKIKRIISGGARGVDSLGEQYAATHNIKLTIIKADWDTYGNRAGIERNQLMVSEALNNGRGACLILWDGQSKGSIDTFSRCISNGLLTYLYYCDGQTRSESPLKIAARSVS